MKRKLLVCFGLISIIFASAQNNLEEGYIINLQNEVIAGSLSISGSDGKKCTFSNGETTNEYKPSDILGYGFKGGRKFSSAIEPEAFVEVLVEGGLSLYRAEKVYYAKKEQDVYRLEETEKEVEENGITYVKKDRKWFGVFSYLVSDCKIDLDPELKLTEKQITRAVVQYNQCLGKEFVEIKEGVDWGRIRLGLGLGYSSSTIKFEDNAITCYAIDGQGIICIDESLTAGSPSLGLLLKITSPRISDNIEAEVGFLYSSFSATDFFVDSNDVERAEHSTVVEFTSISIPVSMKFYKNFGDTRAFFRVGFNLDQIISPESSHNLKYFVTILEDRLAFEGEGTGFFEMNKSLFGFTTGIGASRNFGRVNGELSLNYDQMSSTNITKSFSSNLSRLNLRLVLSKK